METKIRKEIPEEIKKFNWGAFLLTTFWTIRHGLWGSLFLSWIPILGWIIMPFILGFRGNVWAWQKNDYPSATHFLKTQSRWGLAGFLTWPLFIGIAGGYLIYALNFSDSMKMAIDIANHNDRVIDYLGSPIKKQSWLGKIDYQFTLNPKLTTLDVKFEAKGSKNQGAISMHLVKQANVWVMQDLEIHDQNYNVISIIKSYANNATDVYEFPNLVQLQKLVNDGLNSKNQNEYFYYYRSKKLGDYMLVSNGKDNVGEHCYKVGYVHGGIKKAMDQYFEYYPCLKSAQDVSEMLLKYATGTDHFKKDIHWRSVENFRDEDIKKLADQGDADAQNNLGLMYCNGNGIEKDEKRGMSWFEKAANQGHANAQNNLGVGYEDGTGVEKDVQQAIIWYEKAASRGSVIAQHNLGRMYLKGKGVGKDEKQAMLWFEKAANQGDADAQNNLGLMYALGEGVTQNEKQAMAWFEKAANQGDAYGQYNFGLGYAEGKGAEKNEQQAMVWFEKAASQGHVQAQYQLGVGYSNGKGVEKDEKQAMAWFEKAAHQGDAYAQYNLGLMYLKGEGVEKDEKQAMVLFEQAANQGDADAQNNIGAMYFLGKGVEKNKTIALIWFKKAANQGHEQAQYNVKKCMERN